jgi:hypothetical protein
MGNRRWFNIESKSFEFALEEHGGSVGVSIIERGRNSVSGITLGTKGSTWLRKGMAEVHKLPPDQGYVRTLRDEGKTIILQKNRNARGRFISVTEYGVQRRQGSVIIPEGQELWGWRGFSLAIEGLFGNSKPASGKAGTSSGGSKVVSSTRVVPISAKGQLPPKGNGYKSAVINGIAIPEIKGFNLGNISARNKGHIQGNNKEVNAIGDIRLQFKICIGPSGKWEVEEAKIVDHEPVRQARPSHVPLTKNVERPGSTQSQAQVQPGASRHCQQGFTKPKTFWRPVTPSAVTSGLVNGPDPQAHSSPKSQKLLETDGTHERHGHGCDNAIVVFEKITDGDGDGEESNMKPIVGEECLISGDATKWLLRLRDGRNLVLPLMCHCGLRDST